MTMSVMMTTTMIDEQSFVYKRDANTVVELVDVGEERELREEEKEEDEAEEEVSWFKCEFHVG